MPEPASDGREGSAAVAAGERSVGLGLPRSQLLSVRNPKAASVESPCLRGGGPSLATTRDLEGGLEDWAECPDRDGLETEAETDEKRRLSGCVCDVVEGRRRSCACLSNSCRYLRPRESH